MDNVQLFNRQLAQNIIIRKWSTLASLVVLLYEHAITLNEEIRHIWKPSLTLVRLIYIISRYLGIIAQSVNVFLVFWPFSAINIPERSCRRWFIFQMAAACLLISALDIILMLRVYALHRKDRRVGVMLALIFCGQSSVIAVYGPRSVEVPFNQVCDSGKTHSSVLYFCISIWVTHISLAVLTAVRYDLMKMKVPVVRVVTRDGAWIMIIICSWFTTIAPYAIIKQVSKAHVVFGWPISILSISCCRLIMNMQTLDPLETGGDPESLPECLSELNTLQFELQGQ